MKFFTLQLYQQFNSFDDVEAERANEAWEQAIIAYKQQLDSVRDCMSSQLIILSELCLHDAEVLKREEFTDINETMSVAVITLRLNEEIISLFYCLWDHIRVNDAPDNWHGSKFKEYWLYDEVQVYDKCRFTNFMHSIMLSTGVVLDIPFTSVVIHRFFIPEKKIV
jgi:hypothetical protein